jgi:hypothetical protein
MWIRTMTDHQFIATPDWKSINDELTAAYQAQETAADAIDAGGGDAAEYAFEAAHERLWEVVETIAATPTSTVEGLGVKARAARMIRPEYFEGEKPDAREDSSSGQVWWSLVDALDGSARV